jgi:hypothetical protein
LVLGARRVQPHVCAARRSTSGVEKQLTRARDFKPSVGSFGCGGHVMPSISSFVTDPPRNLSRMVIIVDLDD